MTSCFNPRERRLLKFIWKFGPAYFLAVLAWTYATGCITVEGDAPNTIVIPGDEDCDAGVPETDAAPDAPSEPARLSLLFGGPPNGTEVMVGATNVDSLCFQASANVEMEIKTFRIELRSIGGLINGSTPLYRNLKVADTGGPGGIVAGPVELDPEGHPLEQTLVIAGSRVVEAGGSRTFCVRLDVSDSPAFLHGNYLYVGLLPFQPGDVVLTSDGSNLPVENIDPQETLWAQLLIRGVAGMAYALAPDDNESQAGIVVGGTTAVLAKYRFIATGDNLKLTRVRFRLTDVAFDPSVPHGVAQVTLWDGPVLVAGPVPPNGSGYIDFSSFAFVVPQDSTKTLTVKATLNQVGPAGANSGIDVGVTICAGNNDGPCWTGGPEPQEDGTYEVRSAATNAVVDTIGNSGNIQGRTKILRKTRPFVSLASLPTSTLSNGTRVISSFTVTADVSGDLSLKTILLQSTLIDAGSALLAISSPVLREVGQSTNLPIVPFAVTCTAGSNCMTQLTFATEEVIAAGTSRTYELRVNVAGADATGESISTRLIGDTVHVTGSLAGFHGEAVGTGSYHFIWSDISAVPHSATIGGSADWTNGRFVRVLPTDTQTLVRN